MAWSIRSMLSARFGTPTRSTPEAEPSFRFLATPTSCARADLFVVYPWFLSEVISGVPRLSAPYVELARYVAEHRNHHWETVMTHKKSAQVIRSSWDRPYPSKGDEILDRAAEDSGRNFGRIARTGLMDDFAKAAGDRLLSGIPAKYWRRFQKMFTETATDYNVERIMANLSEELADVWGAPENRWTICSSTSRKSLTSLRPELLSGNAGPSCRKENHGKDRSPQD